MRRPWCAAFIAGFAVSCGESGSITRPDGEAIPGIHMTAAVVIIQSGLMPVSVQATLTNTTSEPIDLSYPAGCPVRMRFYDVNDALVYDETTIDCAFNPIATITLEPSESRTLTSGAKNSWTISGDSLPVGRYRVSGILRITGEAPYELDAGFYDLERTTPPGRGAADR